MNADGKRSRSQTPTSTIMSATENPSPKKPRLPTLHTGKRKTALDSFLAKKGESSTALPIGGISPVPHNAVDLGINEVDMLPDLEIVEVVDTAGDRWICPKCGTVFIPMEDTDGTALAGSLTEQRQEHEDYHFALDLQDGGDARATAAKPTAKVRKKTPKKSEGIKAFFTARPTVKKEPT